MKKISKKLSVTAVVIVLCAAWMFGGANVQEQMQGAPEKLKNFVAWLNAVKGIVGPLALAVAAGTYNNAQGKVDAAKEEAIGVIEATKLASSGE